MGEDARQVRCQLVRAGPWHDQRVGQRRLAAADGSGREPAGHGHGVGHPQRPAIRGIGAPAWLSASTAARSPSSPERPDGWDVRSSTACCPTRHDRGCACSLAPRPRRERCRRRIATRVDVVIGDIAKADTAARLLHGIGSDVDVIHTAGHHSPDDHTAVLRDQHQRHRATLPRPRSTTVCAGWCTSRRTARSAPTRSPATRSGRSSRTTRTTATAGRRCRPSWPCSTRSTTVSTRRSCAPVVLRAVPATAADDVLPPGSRRQVSRRRRWSAASVDGVHRQPRRWCDRRRVDACGEGQGYWVADARAVHGQRDRRDRWTGADATRGSA